MKKWEKPELKVLGVENTFEGILPAHGEAGEGLVWICAVCKAHPVNDISDNNHYNKERAIHQTQGAIVETIFGLRFQMVNMNVIFLAMIHLYLSNNITSYK